MTIRFLASSILSEFFFFFFFSCTIAVLELPSAQMMRIYLQCGKFRYDPWFWKDPWRGMAITQYCDPEEFSWTELHRLQSMECKDLDCNGVTNTFISLPSCYWFVDFCLLDLFIIIKKGVEIWNFILCSSISFNCKFASPSSMHCC